MNNTTNEIITPSELAKMIRLGSKDTKQLKYMVWQVGETDCRMFSDLKSEEYDLRPKVTGACALGAAMLVYNGSLQFFLSKVSDEVKDGVLKMNDKLGCTREEIADWLETL